MWTEVWTDKCTDAAITGPSTRAQKTPADPLSTDETGEKLVKVLAGMRSRLADCTARLPSNEITPQMYCLHKTFRFSLF